MAVPPPPPQPLTQLVEPVLDVRELRYSYRSRQALSGVTFTVWPKSIHGFVGPNGAGKTTTLKVLATLLKPQWGSVRVFGHSIGRDYKRARRKIGFMPDTLSIYRQMTVFECLDFFAAAYGMALKEREQTVRDVLALTDMTSRQHDLVRGLSRGMQQRVSLARCLVHDPELLLLDEPAAGLDPRARIELMEVLRELRRLGKTIFISSHILAELGTLCDSVTIIDRGRVKFSGRLEDLLSKEGETVTYRLTLGAESPAVAAALQKTAGVVSVTKLEEDPAYRVTFDKARASTNQVLAAALGANAQVVAFEKDVRELSEAFMDLTEPGVPT
ncbi:MAG: ABC transporter ATP-binding protein [Planctomycetes bacterium]|nr:ABC transporter ATP-binding protein [Planctomycetota bacterium]